MLRRWGKYILGRLDCYCNSEVKVLNCDIYYGKKWREFGKFEGYLRGEWIGFCE